jgi:hypothetical protein
MRGAAGGGSTSPLSSPAVRPRLPKLLRSATLAGTCNMTWLVQQLKSKKRGPRTLFADVSTKFLFNIE